MHSCTVTVALWFVFAPKLQKAEPFLSGWMGMSFDQQGDHGQQLVDGATAIMLRRLPSKLMIESFLDILNQFWLGRYNFVYVPHDKSRARNVALAFVNFTDSEAARTAFAYFQGRSHPMDVRLGSHIRVSQADVQGLNLNLAYFIARSGLTDMENPHAPRVFENGRRVNLLEAAKKHVTMQLVAQASQHMKAVEDARARQAARPRRDPPKQDLRSHDTRPVRGYVQQHVNVRMTAICRHMYMCDKLTECMLGIRAAGMTAAHRRRGYRELPKAVGRIPAPAALPAIRRQDTDVVRRNNPTAPSTSFSSSAAYGLP
eukprot:s2305_g1.t1